MQQRTLVMHSDKTSNLHIITLTQLGKTRLFCHICYGTILRDILRFKNKISVQRDAVFASHQTAQIHLINRPKYFTITWMDWKIHRQKIVLYKVFDGSVQFTSFLKITWLQHGLFCSTWSASLVIVLKATNTFRNILKEGMSATDCPPCGLYLTDTLLIHHVIGQFKSVNSTKFSQ